MGTLVDAGFIIWGFLALYVAITIAYGIWMVIANRRDSADSRPHEPQE